MTSEKESVQPWQKNHYNSFGIIRLHEEIIDFCNYVQPTGLEEIVRYSVLNRVKNLLVKRWPLIDVQIFGSFATGLYLPTSDIDMVVFGKWETLPLWDVEKLLKENDISENIRVIDKASVPIVKFTDKKTRYQVDISFNKDNGIKSIPVINSYLAQYPNLRPLYLILKQFMLQRDLNEVWTGGISSYCLMILCISFLQNYNKNYNGTMNLGCLLMEFFELYGRCFNFFNAAIYITKKGGYRVKVDDGSNPKSSIISIDDPVEKGNDVAKSCFGLFNIRNAFSHAYCMLVSRVVPVCMINTNSNKSQLPMNSSILGSIINLSGDSIKFRQEIQSKFAALVDYDRKRIEFLLPTAVLPNDDESFVSNKSSLPRRSKRKVDKKTRTLSNRLKPQKKINQARHWSDLAQWSQENVFKSPVLFRENER